MLPVNPTLPPDPILNPLTPTFEQMTFMYTYYPTYAQAPLDMVVWLYNYALYNEQQAIMMKSALDNNQDPDQAYSQPPKNKFSKVKGKKNKGDDEDELDEDVQYLNMRDLRKKKPLPQA